MTFSIIFETYVTTLKLFCMDICIFIANKQFGEFRKNRIFIHNVVKALDELYKI